MSLGHAMLGLLAERSRSGYELTKEFQGSLAHAWPASHSQIYPELARLVANGHISQSAAGPRGAKIYEITPAGLAEVRRWLRESVPARPTRSDALLRVLLVWLLDAPDRQELLRRELDFQRATLADLEQAAAAMPETNDTKAAANRVALDYGLAMTRARVAWAERAVQVLGGGSPQRSSSP